MSGFYFLKGRYLLDPSAFGKFELIDGKVDGHSESLPTIFTLIKIAGRKPRLFASVCGGGWAGESGGMTQVVGRLYGSRDGPPELFDAAFVAGSWGLMTYQFNKCVMEGSHYSGEVWRWSYF